MTEYEPGLANVKLHLIESVSDANDFLNWLGERRPYNAVAIDLETGELPGNNTKDALSPWRGRIRLMQIGDGMTGWAFAWDEWAGLYYEFMRKYSGLLVAHNVAFESKWLTLQARVPFPWAQAHDTMLMAQVISPNTTAALKPLSAQLVDRKAAAMQGALDDGMRENGWTWGTVPISFPPYHIYGALDPVLTMRLFDKFWEQVGPGKPFAEAYEIEMQYRKIATQMELHGARVDLEYSQMMLDKLTDYTGQVKEWVKQNHAGTSITSNIQMVRRFEHLGGEITEFTKSGGKSVTKEQLQKFVRDGSTDVAQLAQLALDQRKADKLASSYFSNFLKDNIDGVLHPSIRTMAARTGRSSITEPALQTLPSGDATVRRAFISRDENWGIVSSDLDQVEFRLTANFSEDQRLISVFKEADATGGDVFTTIMQQVYDDLTLVKSDPRRKLIKSTVYGKLYGAGPEKMALTAGVSTKQMKSVVDAFDSSYPGVKLFQKKIEDKGMRRLKSEGEAFVNTPTGRRLPGDADRVYSLTNYLIQGTAAEVFKKNLIEMDQADLTQYMVVPVHDEIVMEVPKADAEDIKRATVECMTTREGWDVPLTADVEGPFDNWGIKYQAGH